VSLDDDEIPASWVAEAERRGEREALDFDAAIAQANARLAKRRVAQDFLEDALPARQRLSEHWLIGKAAWHIDICLALNVDPVKQGMGVDVARFRIVLDYRAFGRNRTV